MPLYAYQAISPDGKKTRGTVDATSISQVREQLTRRGLYVTSISQVVQTAPSGLGIRRLFARKVSAKEVIFFTKQLAVLLKAGVPLLEALNLLVEQTEGSLRSIVISLRDAIKEGKSLADGLAVYPQTFDNIYVQLVRAGEASGRLEIILDRLTTFLERRQTLRKTIRSALRNPMIQLGVIVLVVIILLVYVVPQMTETFAEQGAELPWTTKILIELSGFIINHYLILLISLISLVLLFRFWKSTPSGKYILDVVKLRLPIIGYFARMNAIVQFSRTLGMLLEGGVNLAEALDIVVKIVDNQVLVNELNQARENIIKQGRVADYLKRTGLFPPLAIYLINTGEQSGELDKMLLAVAQHYEEETTEYSEGLAASINPIMLMIMAVVVGFILISIVTPMLQMNELASL